MLPINGGSHYFLFAATVLMILTGLLTLRRAGREGVEHVQAGTGRNTGQTTMGCSGKGEASMSVWGGLVPMGTGTVKYRE